MFVIILIVILVIFYFYGFTEKNEGFRIYDSGFRGFNTNNYESIGIAPTKKLYLNPPNNSESDIDYQDYLNEVSGYDSGTRGYNNPVYASKIAAGLNTN
jgi:hypothetical protein